MDDETKQIINRLRSVEGHVRGVERMVTEGAYCIDIVNQISAIEAALHKVNGLVLDRHLRTCVTTAIRSDDTTERERVINEIMGVFNAKK
jgi:DNA-binding FrmR family transcriptional regulator